MTDKTALRHPENAHRPDNPVTMREAVLAAHGQTLHM